MKALRKKGIANWGWAAVLASILLISACSGNQTPSNANASNPAGSTPTASETSAAPEQPVKLVLMTRGDTYDADNAFVPIMEEATNTILEYQVIQSNDYNNKRNVVMASGDYPNTIRVGFFEPAYQRYLEEQLLLPLDDYLEKYPVVKDAFSEEQWNTVRNPKDEKIYMIPRFTGLFPLTLSYRKDWTEQLKIPEPKTTEDYRAMLQAFKEANLDNVNDFIPFTPNNQTPYWINPFFSAYGVDYMAWIPSEENPDQLVFANSLPAFKDALTYVRELRNDGLFDNTWMLNNDRGLFKFYAGQAGATTDSPQFKYLRQEAVQKVNPDGDIGYIHGLIGQGGIQGGTLVSKAGMLDAGTVITVSTTPEQVDAFFRLLTWQYTDGYDTMKYGVEGINYDIQDGKKIIRNRDDVIKNDPKYHPDMMARIFQVEPPRFFNYTSENYPEVSPDELDYVSGVLEKAESMLRYTYLVNQDDPAITENIANLQKAVDEVIAKIVLDPNSDIDKEYSDYLKNLKNYKLDDVTEAVNRLNTVE